MTPDVFPPWLVRPGPYAGIGARATPAPILGMMRRLARALDARGFTLRSGGATGADSAFEAGADGAEVFLPWRGFNGRAAPIGFDCPTPEAHALSARFHPNWASLSYSARRLHARNAHQVLGLDLSTPALFVLCWTPDGAVAATSSTTGGTGQAIRIAAAHEVPVFNLARPEHRATWEPLAAEVVRTELAGGQGWRGAARRRAVQ